jgi:hypothetical protein
LEHLYLLQLHYGTSLVINFIDGKREEEEEEEDNTSSVT